MRILSQFSIFIGLFLNGPFAWANAEAAEANPMSSLIMMAIIVGAMYLMVIRPQTKRAKDHHNLVNGLSEGDEVVTTGGLMGKITSIDNEKNILKVNIAENTEVFVQRTMVASVLPKKTLKNL